MFGTTAIVSTLHAYAYANVVRQYKLNPNIAPFLTWRDIPKHIKKPFGVDGIALNYVEGYCNSPFLNFSDYKSELENDDIYDYRAYKLASQLLDEMANGKMRITHSWYLKFFHILVVNGTIKLEPMDKVLIDEAQDLSSITLDIFEAIPAKQKVLVGDTNQKIFSFLNLEDGFLRYPNAKVLELSKSFRVDSSYAPSINRFMSKYLDSTTEFTGMDYPPEPKLVTKAYLTRTNSALIAKMIELNKTGTPYHLATKTKVKQMFKWSLALVYAKAGHKQLDPELKGFQHDIDEWARSKSQHGLSLYRYLNKLEVPPQLKQAMALLLKFNKEDVIKASTEAIKHQKTQCNLSLLTSFASKGITRDIIELDEDVNKAVFKVMAIPEVDRTEADLAELNLAFVSVTRHRHKLINCKFLT